jgi:hypothetical protein
MCAMTALGADVRLRAASADIEAKTASDLQRRCEEPQRGSSSGSVPGTSAVRAPPRPIVHARSASAVIFDTVAASTGVERGPTCCVMKTIRVHRARRCPSRRG